VNEFVSGEQTPVPILKMDEAGFQRQVARLNEVRRSRDNRAVQRCLVDLAQAARRQDVNLMQPILAAVHEYATLQEMMDVLREVWGIYEEPVIL
jgi:methylmalonyl-CoA mutase N-terminal domain/subunit